jgi:hypothetical protein
MGYPYVISFQERQRPMRYRYDDDISKTIVMQRSVGVTPVAAAATIVVSVFTAHRRWGIAVPVFALALLVADSTIVAVTVAQ